MTWHLRDRKLEEKLIAIGPDFVDKLQKAVKYHKNDSTVFVGLGSGIAGRSRLIIEFRWGELEEIPKYDPSDWNEYPKVMPPKGVPMRIEYKNREGNIVRECAFFIDVKGAPLPAYWFSAKSLGIMGEAVDDAYSIDDNNYLIEDGMKLRFRPWEDVNE